MILSYILLIYHLFCKIIRIYIKKKILKTDKLILEEIEIAVKKISPHTQHELLTLNKYQLYHQTKSESKICVLNNIHLKL